MAIIYNGEKDTRLYKGVLGPIIEGLMDEDEKVVYLDADLMNCIGTSKLAVKTPRAIDCGISEANMIGVAAGLSSQGFKPICHSFGIFASRRVFDQVFLSAGYAKNPITVIGTDAGICAELNGGTHMPFEDVGTYRLIPGSVICDCTDVTMMKAFLTLAKDSEGVKYVRCGRKDSYPTYSEDTKFEFGKGFVVRDGKDCVIVASGIMVHEAMQAAKALAEEGIDAAVIDPFTVKPLDVDLIRSYVAKTGKIVVAENHNAVGGLCSAVESCIAGMACKYGRVAVEESYGEVGPKAYLRERFGLSSEHIVEIIKGF